MIESEFSKIIQAYFNNQKGKIAIPIETIDDDGVPDLCIMEGNKAMWVELKVIDHSLCKAKFQHSQFGFHNYLEKKQCKSYIWILDNDTETVIHFRGSSIFRLSNYHLMDCLHHKIFMCPLNSYEDKMPELYSR